MVGSITDCVRSLTSHIRGEKDQLDHERALLASRSKL
jgi:hypothetical protein